MAFLMTKGLGETFAGFLLNSNALKIRNNPDREDGCFVLKSGRISPFFMNLGSLNEGWQLAELGAAYATRINEQFGENIDVVFGPAYKGIPLAVLTTEALYNEYGVKHTRYCSNRKEIKDHGDSGILLGSKLRDGEKVVIVEDVTTSGKSIDETIPILKAQADVEIVGMIVSFDRMEVAYEGANRTALEEISHKYGFKACAISSIKDVISLMKRNVCLDEETLEQFKDYYEKYGVPGKGVIE